MAELPEDLRAALDSDDAEEFGQLLRRRRPEDFQALQELLSPEPSIPPDHRTKAMYALGRWGDPSVVPAIRRLLPELDERGRISAVSARRPPHLVTIKRRSVIAESGPSSAHLNPPPERSCGRPPSVRWASCTPPPARSRPAHRRSRRHAAAAQRTPGRRALAPPPQRRGAAGSAERAAQPARRLAGCAGRCPGADRLGGDGRQAGQPGSGPQTA